MLRRKLRKWLGIERLDKSLNNIEVALGGKLRVGSDASHKVDDYWPEVPKCETCGDYHFDHDPKYQDSWHKTGVKKGYES